MLCADVDCDDQNECTTDACDPADGECAHTTVTDGTTCDFGGLPGVCAAGVCEDAILCSDVVCDDGNECTDDTCDPLDGECDYTNVTAGMTCNFGGLPGVCAAGVCEDAMLCSDVVCDDGNECTQDACDPMDGQCGHADVMDGTTCDFGGLPGVCGAGVCEDAMLCSGVDCDTGCGDQCVGQEVCVDGQCCEPTYPCADNECSPAGGLPDGCGGLTQCPPCANGDDCVLSETSAYECVGDCTCEAQGIECGNASICGSPTLCGTCADNGFEGGYHCESGRCVCEDSFEFNDSFSSMALICGEGTGLNCMQDAWGIDLQATLHNSQDIDYYALQVLDSTTPLIAQAYGGLSDRILSMSYLCPDGFEGIDKCSGSTNSIGGIQFCIAEGDTVGIERRCDDSASAGIGTVLVGVEAREFRSDCDGYGLNIYATYTTDLPVEF